MLFPSLRSLLAPALLMLFGGGILFGSAHAQSPNSGTVEGSIVQKPGGSPLAGANVRLAETNRGTATRSDGTFRLQLAPGTYTLIASAVGFESARQSVAVRAGETTAVTFRLLEQPIEISEIVVERVMMTGGQRGLDEIPGSAHYISPAEMETFSYNDPHRVLQQVPGVYIQEEDGYGLRPNIGLRGTGVERSSKITIMEDGVLAAPAPYAAPSAYYFPTVGRMQAVEVRKGSSQIKYGPYTTGGAINFVSSQIPNEFSGRVNVLAGSDQERTVHARVGDAYDNVGFLAETYQARTEGFKDITGFNNADAGLDFNTGFDKQDYLAKLRLNTDDDAAVYQALTIKASHTEETSNETYLGLTDADFERAPFARYAGSQEDVMNTEHQQIQARHFIRPAEWLDVTTTAYHNAFQRNWFKLDDVRDGRVDDPIRDENGTVVGMEDTDVGISTMLENPERWAEELAIVKGQASADGRLEVKNNNREYFSQGVQTAVGLTFDGSRRTHELELGLRLHQDEIDRFQWVNDFRMADGGAMELVTEREPGTESNRVTSATAVASYAQYTLTAGAWTVTPGLRVEHIDLERVEYPTDSPTGRARTTAPSASRENTVDVVIPGVGVDYRWSESLSTFAGVHKGFAPPGSDPDTDPESSINYELGTRYRTEAARVQGVAFWNDYSNLLGRELQAAGDQQSGNLFNGGEARVYGLEVSARYDAGMWAETSFSLPIELSYTLTQAEFQSTFDSDFGAWGTVEDGDELPYLPEHQLAVGIGIGNLSGVGVHLNGRYVDAMRTVAGQGDLVDDASIDGHFVLDVAADYAVSPYATIFASVRNLADNTYAVARRPAGLRPGMPRVAQLGVKVSF